MVAAVTAAGARAAELGANIGFVILIPIFALFFLKDKSCLAGLALNLIDDPQRRHFLTTVFAQLDRMLAQYIRAQLILAALAMVAYTAFLSVVQFPYALMLGVTAGTLEFIPFVGPAITAVMLATIGFFSGYAHWLLVLVFVGVWRLIQDYVNTPYFMSEGLELHPLAAIFGILVGGEVFGIPGMFLSIPVLAGLRIVWHNWQVDAVPPGIRDSVRRLPVR
jgi:predicted PurR-regulated permease PerM